MLVQVTEYQLAWHPERSPRCRYKLATEDDWSGWLDLDLTDQLLMSMLLSQQPVIYNQLTGVLCMGAGYGEPEAAQAAMPEASAAYAADAVPVGTPNSGDDDEAQAEGSGAAAQQALGQGQQPALPLRVAQGHYFLKAADDPQLPPRRGGHQPRQRVGCGGVGAEGQRHMQQSVAAQALVQLRLPLPIVGGCGQRLLPGSAGQEVRVAVRGHVGACPQHQVAAGGPACQKILGLLFGEYRAAGLP